VEQGHALGEKHQGGLNLVRQKLLVDEPLTRSQAARPEQC
jgi:hypothetical protein